MSRKSNSLPTEFLDNPNKAIVAMDILRIDPPSVLLPGANDPKIADYLIIPQAYIEYARINDGSDDDDTSDKNYQRNYDKNRRKEARAESYERLVNVSNEILRNMNGSFYECKNGMKIFLDRRVTVKNLDTSQPHYIDMAPQKSADHFPGTPILTNSNGLENDIILAGRHVVRKFVNRDYTGRRDLRMPTDKDFLESWTAKGFVTMTQFETAFPKIGKLHANEFIEFHGNGINPEDYQSYIGRYQKIDDRWVIQNIRGTNDIPYFKPAHAGQAMLLDLCNDPSLSRIFCKGGAGAGKTYGMLSYAAHSYLLPKKGTNPKYRHMIAVVPGSHLGESYGALPGGLFEKLSPKVKAYIKNLTNIVLAKSAKEGQKINYSAAVKLATQLVLNNIELIAMCDLQGVTEDECLIFADECQNNKYREIESISTRGGKGSLTMIFGDAGQSALCNSHNCLCDFDYVYYLIARKDIGSVGMLRLKNSEQARDQDIIDIEEALRFNVV